MAKQCIRLHGVDRPPNRAAAYQLIEHLFTRDKKAIVAQFNIWTDLRNMAQQYSAADARRVSLDLDRLKEMQDFDDEACILELFNWRKIGEEAHSESITRREARALLDPDESQDRRSTRLPSLCKAGGEDEYELDPAAELEAAEAERKMERRRKGLEVSSEDESEDDSVAITHTARSANAAAQPQQSTLSSWRKKTSKSQQGNASSPTHAAAAAGAESIDEESDMHDADAEAEEEDDVQVIDSSPGTTAINATPASSQMGGWRKKAALPLTSVPSPPSSETKPKSNGTLVLRSPSAAAPSAPLSIDALIEGYQRLNGDDRLTFLADLAPLLQPNEARKLVQSTNTQCQNTVREHLNEMHQAL